MNYTAYLAEYLPAGVTVNNVTASDTAMTFGETIVSKRDRKIADTLSTFAETMVSNRLRQLADTLSTFADTIVSKRLRSIADTALTFAESIVSNRVRAIADTALAFSDSVARRLPRVVADIALTMDSAPLLDNANRANENPATGWTADFDNQSAQGIKVVSNQLVSINASLQTTAWWNAQQFAADQEAYFTIATKQGNGFDVFINLRIQNPHTASVNGYNFTLSAAAGTDQVSLWKEVAGVYTQIGSSVAQEFNAGDIFRARSFGTTHTISRFDGASWTLVASWSDASISGAGYIGIGHNAGANAAFDNFGGGVAAGDTVTVVKSYARAIADTATSFAETLTSKRLRTLADTALTFADTLLTNRTRQIIDTLSTFGDSVVKSSGAIQRSVSDTALTVADTVTSLRLRNISDTLSSFSDTTATGRLRKIIDALMGVLLNDTFTRSVGGGWNDASHPTADDGHTAWVGGNANTSVDGSRGKQLMTAGGDGPSLITDPGLRDVELTGACTWNIDASGNLNRHRFFLRYTPSVTNGIEFNIEDNSNGGNIRINVLDTSQVGPGSGDIILGVNRAPGDLVRFRFRLIGSHAQMRVWRDGDAEPTAWDIDVILANDISTKGGLMWQAYRGSTGGDVSYQVDELVVNSFIEVLTMNRIRQLVDTAFAVAESITTKRTRMIADTLTTFSDSVVKSGAQFARSISDTVTTFADNVTSLRLRQLADTAASFSEQIVSARLRKLADDLFSVRQDENLAQNPSVETDLIGWTLRPAGTGETMTRDSAHAHAGSWAVKHFTNGQYGSVVDTGMALKAGFRYRAGVWVFSDTAASFRWTISTNTTSFGSGTRAVAVSANTWTLIEAISDLPSDIDQSAYLRVEVDSASVLNAWYDDVYSFVVADTLALKVGRSINDTLSTFVETLVTNRRRMIVDTLSTFADTAVKVGGQFARSVSDTATAFTDAITSNRLRAIADTALTVSDTTATGRTRMIADTAATFSDSAVSVFRKIRAVSDTALTFGETIALKISRNISDTLTTFADTAVKTGGGFQRSISDTLSAFTDAITSNRLRQLADTALTVSDTLTTKRSRSISDTALTLNDTTASVQLRLRAVSDTSLTMTDTLQRRVGHFIADTGLAMTDTVTHRPAHYITDTALSMSDSVVVVFTSGAISPTPVSTFTRSIRPKSIVYMLPQASGSLSRAVQPSGAAWRLPEPSTELRRSAEGATKVRRV
jgi:hypothetical protein